MKDRLLDRILDHFDLSREGYGKVRRGATKRISRHMKALDCRDVEEYLGLLERNPPERAKAKEFLTVTISRFFRDPDLWETLMERIIPDLTRAGEAVQVWSAGCASGEEPYSLKILWDRMGRRRATMTPLEIRATDINPAVLKKAREALYPRSSLKNMDDSCVNEYFRPVKKNLYALRHDLKRSIHWVVHDLTSQGMPGEEFDLIFLRNNLLTYYKDTIKTPALTRIVEALRWGGWLIVGKKEKVPPIGLPLKPSVEHPCIFRKTLPDVEE
jgi:chemotaxis protein methyltransferase CheR